MQEVHWYYSRMSNVFSADSKPAQDSRGLYSLPVWLN